MRENFKQIRFFTKLANPIYTTGAFVLLRINNLNYLEKTLNKKHSLPLSDSEASTMAISSGGTISFSGLASGLDTKAILEQLVAIKEKAFIKPLEDEIENIKIEKETLSPIETAFNTLKLKSEFLKRTDDIAWNAKKAASSDTSNIIISGINSSKAIAGNYSITSVTQLAQADRVIFDGKGDRSTTQLGTGTLDITYKSVTTNINITSTNNTLQGVANAINNANAGVTASIINDGDAANPYRLVLTANDTGDDTTITHNLDSILSVTVDAVASTSAANEPQNASFVLNAVTIESKKNTVTDAVPGVTLNLVKETASATTITISHDTEAMITAIEDFVTAYKDLKTLLKKTTNFDKDTGSFGPLGQDIILTSANVNIASMLGRSLTSLTGFEYTNLTQIGITTGVSGELSLDSSKLTSALEANLDDVKLLFQGSGSEQGIAQKLFIYMDSLLSPEGSIAGKKRAMDSKIERLDEQKDTRQLQINEFHLRMFKKFNQLERTLSTLQAQEGQVNSFASVYSNSANRLL